MSVSVASIASSRRRFLPLVEHQFRYDLRCFWRNTQSRFFTLALPVLFLVIFASVFMGQNVAVPGGRINESVYYVPGIIAFGVIAATFSNLTVNVVNYRESGVYKRRRATPVPASVVIAGRALVACLMALVLTAVLLAIGWAAYGAHIPGRTAPAFLLDIVLAPWSSVASVSPWPALSATQTPLSRSFRRSSSHSASSPVSSSHSWSCPAGSSTSARSSLSTRSPPRSSRRTTRTLRGVACRGAISPYSRSGGSRASWSRCAASAGFRAAGKAPERCSGDFEAACSGPVEWDWSPLPERVAEHARATLDAEVLNVCRLLRSLIVTTWCWSQPG